MSLLLDHNTLEASFSLLKKKRKGFDVPDRGTSWDIDAEKCAANLKKSRLTQAGLIKEIGIIFDGYAHKILQPAQSEAAYQQMARLADKVTRDGTEFILLIPGYHPVFWQRLQREFPEIAARHEEWLKRLKALQKPGIKVLDFFAKLPGDDGSPLYWSDGVHFSCHGAMQMLTQVLR